MIRRILPPICVTLVTCLAGCSSEDPSTEAQSVQSVSSAAHELSFALVAKEYRGGEVEKHWHLTTWTLKNDSCEHIAEAVVVVSLFDRSLFRIVARP